MQNIIYICIVIGKRPDDLIELNNECVFVDPLQENDQISAQKDQQYKRSLCHI